MSDLRASRFITFRNAFISGLLLLAPLVFTVWAFSRIIDVVGGTFRPLFFFYIPDAMQDKPSLAVVWDILATMLVIVFVTGFGLLSHYFLGKYFGGLAERAISSIPGVSAVYNTIKQIVGTFSTQNRNLFSQVVLVEFPRKGVWTLGFLTSREQGEVRARLAETDLRSVFVPTTPNPTGGFLLMLPAADVVELDMSVGDAMKMIISGGAVVPPWTAPVKPVASIDA